MRPAHVLVPLAIGAAIIAAAFYLPPPAHAKGSGGHASAHSAPHAAEAHPVGAKPHPAETRRSGVSPIVVTIRAKTAGGRDCDPRREKCRK